MPNHIKTQTFSAKPYQDINIWSSERSRSPIIMKPVMELMKHFFIQRILLYIIITFFSFFVIVPLGDLRVSRVYSEYVAILLKSKGRRCRYVHFSRNLTIKHRSNIELKLSNMSLCPQKTTPD